MAFNLRAILKLDDQFTNPMRKIERQMRQTESMTKKMSDSNNRLNSTMNQAKYQAHKMQSGLSAASASVLGLNNQINRIRKSADTYRDANGRLRDSMGKFVAESNRLGRAAGLVKDSFRMMGAGASGAVKSIFSLKAGFVALAGAIGGAMAAKKIFDTTVGEAAKFEQSSIMIDAMFDDKKVSERYKDMMQKMAIDSPLLNSQDIFGNSKSFIMLTKNTDQLKEMWSLVERLNAVDPAQGVEGAVFALKELFSGDARSMVERFEMDRQTLKGIKNLSLERQLVELDKYFNKMGLTQKLIDKMGGTTLGLWNQVQEQFQLVLRQMGEPSLKVLSNFFTNILDKLQNGELDKFASVGGKIIQSVLNGLTNGAMSIYNWFTQLANSEEFKRQTTLTGKVQFIIEDIYDRFRKWFDGGGREKVEQTVTSVVEVIAGGIEGAVTVLLPLAVKLGSAIGDGIIQGIKESASDNMIMAALGSPQDSNRYAQKKATEYTGKLLWKWFGPDKKKKGKSHASGLDRVPYNGYQATLHKDEKVLTPEEAKAQRNGASGITIAKLADQIVVREDADIDKIAEALYTKINGALEAGA
ncbi:hypothetical protein HYI36_19965 [Bacillus sp. Gen3]|nr:hypothetical protein [Bacillus sp. Gen3]